jgi:nucleoside-diphosphate-sugar epimerase
MKTLLFTGATGFIGSNILHTLQNNYLVDTLSVSYKTTYQINIAEQIPLLNKQYDIVLHAAGKAHSIPNNPGDAKVFYSINYEGTKNLCIGLERKGLPSTFVFISSVAVYGCDTGDLISEDQPLNAKTPYGKSKMQAEEYLSEWCYHKKINLLILRPSLLAGKNPPGNLGAMVKGISKGRYFAIADGNVKKSVAMVDDIARLIPYCEEKSGIFNVCDSYHPSFHELEKVICTQLNKPLPLSIPLTLARGLAGIGDYFDFIPINSDRLMKITQSLTFSNNKLKNELNFLPLDVLTNFVIK